MDDVSCSQVVKLPDYMHDLIPDLAIFGGTFGRVETFLEFKINAIIFYDYFFMKKPEILKLIKIQMLQYPGL